MLTRENFIKKLNILLLVGLALPTISFASPTQDNSNFLIVFDKYHQHKAIDDYSVEEESLEIDRITSAGFQMSTLSYSENPNDPRKLIDACHPAGASREKRYWPYGPDAPLYFEVWESSLLEVRNGKTVVLHKPTLQRMRNVSQNILKQHTSQRCKDSLSCVRPAFYDAGLGFGKGTCREHSRVGLFLKGFLKNGTEFSSKLEMDFDGNVLSASAEDSISRYASEKQNSKYSAGIPSPSALPSVAMNYFTDEAWAMQLSFFKDSVNKKMLIGF